MIISVERSSLLDAVTRLQRVVSSKTSMPVLEGILLSAEQGKVTLVSYNLEMGMRKEIYAKCDEAGDIVINARLLGDILRRMNAPQVVISSNEKLACNIKCGEATFDIMGMAAEDFPEMPTVGSDRTLKIDGSLLSEMVKGTFFATAQNEGAKPILTGINVTVKDSVMQFVAIDGYRLAIKRENVDISDDFSFILSGKAVSEAVKLIDENTEDVEMRVGENLISFNINGYDFISRLLEGEFVNYQKTIPSEHTQRVVVNTRELIDTIERVSLLISESFSTPVRCYFNELNVVFTCATSMGRAAETFNTQLEGDSFEIGLNSRYLLDALKAVGDEKVQILFNGANAGVLILPIEGNSFTYMIMPMRLR
ncbi:MAG: DNA polymerase III subunit beta [Acutalibacteraceae bacterium]|nr:DNA polymerase III subunit beta [Clostridia bacterium]MEE1330888.1 DNA polymerase III subunit beta [Acutalibacteraceae bacterium]